VQCFYRGTLTPLTKLFTDDVVPGSLEKYLLVSFRIESRILYHDDPTKIQLAKIMLYFLDDLLVARVSRLHPSFYGEF
jgi:hypothetical protein